MTSRWFYYQRSTTGHWHPVVAEHEPGRSSEGHMPTICDVREIPEGCRHLPLDYLAKLFPCSAESHEPQAALQGGEV